jgi:hypothetical protein
MCFVCSNFVGYQAQVAGIGAANSDFGVVAGGEGAQLRGVSFGRRWWRLDWGWGGTRVLKGNDDGR